MSRPRNRRRGAGAVLAALAVLAGCGEVPSRPPAQETAAAPAAPGAPLGLMSSLPLTWPLGAGLGEIAAGTAPVPWQRTALEEVWALVPLDTLSAVPGIGPDAPATEPLEGLARVAVIQPRGLSPADNVALDDWVRGGGRLLLVLDPALSGDYDLPLGDPRHPAAAALIPPVVARWGLAVSFDEEQDEGVRTVRLGTATLPLILPGQIAIADPAAARCTILAQGAAARCRVGEGQVTLIADAAIFEHEELAGEGGAALRALVAAAFE